MEVDAAMSVVEDGPLPMDVSEPQPPIQQNGVVESEDNDLQDVKLKELTLEQVMEKERRIRKLTAKLRAEEAKLFLLKKVRQNQLLAKENILSPSGGIPSSVPANVPLQLPVPPRHQASSPTRIELPSHQVPRVAHDSRPSNRGVYNPPLPAHSRHGLPPPPLGMSSAMKGFPGVPAPAHSGSSGHGHHRSLRETPVTTPPNVVLGYPGPSARSSPKVVEQTPEQKRAAAKASLRKQLEKTLLQIPPPKPPPPEMHFIPNANNTEFVYYLGLESVVDQLTNQNINKGPPDPFECCQCGTDFTPVWKWQEIPDPKENNRPAVICEGCVSNNIKKALKAEHTSRLKKAFQAAQQQEQEIEARIAAGTYSPPPLREDRTRNRSPNVTNGLVQQPIRESFVREDRSILAREHQTLQEQIQQLQQHHQAQQVREHREQVRERVRDSDRVRDREHHRERESHHRNMMTNSGNIGLPTPPAAHSSGFSGVPSNNNSASSSSAARMAARAAQAQAQADQAANANNMAAMVAQHAALLQNLHKMTPVQQQALLLQAQQLATSLPPQAHGLPGAAAALPGLAPFLYQFGLLGKSLPGLTPDQLQRQFLLDLIAPQTAGRGSSSTGGNINWKS